MRKRFIVAAVLGASLAFSQVGVASADTATVTANVTSGGIGLRSLTSVPAITLLSTAGSSTVDGSMAAVVTEAAVTGDTAWSVTAALSTLTNGGNTLANSNVDIKNRAVVQVAGGGTSAPVTGTQDMSAARTLFNNSGEVATSVYTGTHSATADLSLHVPNGTATGIYSGTMTVTLVQ